MPYPCVDRVMITVRVCCCRLPFPFRLFFLFPPFLFPAAADDVALATTNEATITLHHTTGPDDMRSIWLFIMPFYLYMLNC
jgi:hypothetical protein